MQCTHGKPIIGYALESECRRCNDNKVFKNNQRLARRALRNCADHLKNAFIDLAREAVRTQENPHFFVVENITRRLKEKNALLAIQTLNDLQPRVIFHDRRNDRIFVFNPFVSDQKWDVLTGKNGHKHLAVDAQVKQVRQPVQRILANRKVTDISVSMIDPYKDAKGRGQIRLPSSRAFQIESIKEMAKSFLSIEHKLPIIVRAKKNGRFEVIAGERRLRAAKLCGKKHLMAIVIPADVPDAQIHDFMVTENSHREEISYVEKALEIQRLQERDLKIEDIALRLGISVSHANRIAPLAQLPMEVINVINANTQWVSLSSALELLKIPSKEEQLRAVQKWVEYRKEIREGVSRKNPPPAPARESAVNTTRTSAPVFVPKTTFVEKPRQAPPVKTSPLGASVLTVAGVKKTVDGTTPEQERLISLLEQMATALTTANSLYARIFEMEWAKLVKTSKQASRFTDKLIRIEPKAKDLLDNLPTLLEIISELV